MYLYMYIRIDICIAIPWTPKKVLFTKLDKTYQSQYPWTQIICLTLKRESLIIQLLQCFSGHLMVTKLNKKSIMFVLEVLMLTSSAGGDVRGFGDSRRQETSIVVGIIVAITITMITVIIADIVVIIAVIVIIITITIITRVSASGRSRGPRTGARPNHRGGQDSLVYNEYNWKQLPRHQPAGGL